MNQKPAPICPLCSKPANTKNYIGSTETYNYCGKCFHTFGGEETKAKKDLIHLCAQISEEDELDM